MGGGSTMTWLDMHGPRSVVPLRVRERGCYPWTDAWLSLGGIGLKLSRGPI